jgi:hypothetical protein
MSSIEERVSKLEDVVFGKTKREKNWRSTVGMFDNDPFMQEVIDGALKSREQERNEAVKTSNSTNSESK